ncbi:MAG: hypothetical protein M3Q24_00515 [bacterium]|nr:hypothetical protein [bacterium]
MNIKIGIIVGILAITGMLIGTAVSAKGKGETRPGWGYGDKNHVHTGPPGASVRP